MQIKKDVASVLSAILSMITCIVPTSILSISKMKFEEIKEKHKTKLRLNGNKEETNDKPSSSTELLLVISHSIMLFQTILFILYLNYIYNLYNSNQFLKYPKYNFIVLILLFLTSCVNSYVSYIYGSESLLYVTDG